MNGIYTLLMRMPGGLEIDVGRLGATTFRRGYYAYVGSAQNGLEPRIRRYLMTDKKIHWHIDYLTRHADILETYVNPGGRPCECEVARRLADRFEVVEGFVSSDCPCSGHLFYDTSGKHLIDAITEAGMESMHKLFLPPTNVR